MQSRKDPPATLAKKARSSKSRVTSTKLAISFDRVLAAQVQKAATHNSAGNVAAWLAEAARDHLKAARRRVSARLAEAALQSHRTGHWATSWEQYEAKHGKITEEALAAAEAAWPRTDPRRKRI